MSRASTSRAITTVALILTALFQAPFAFAETSQSDQATALRLFFEGKKLLDDGRPTEACPKLAQSDALDPEVGTKMNLARCYEAEGRTTSAYMTWRLAAAAASKRAVVEPTEEDRKKQSMREAYATSRVAALGPRLLHVAFRVSEPVDAGTDVRLDGEPLTRDRWDAAVSVDPGMHQVVVAAPTKKAWSRAFEVAEENGPLVIIVVPPLAAIPAATAAAADANENPLRATAVALEVVTGAGVLAGAGFGIAAIVGQNNLAPDCTPSLNCNAQGISKLSTVKTNVALADISFAVAGAALIGAVLCWTLPIHSHAVYVQPSGGVGSASVALRGAW